MSLHQAMLKDLALLSGLSHKHGILLSYLGRLADEEGFVVLTPGRLAIACELLGVSDRRVFTLLKELTGIKALLVKVGPRAYKTAFLDQDDEYQITLTYRGDTRSLSATGITHDAD